MRLNQYIAFNSKLSRRKADQLIRNGKVLVNHRPAVLGQIIDNTDKVFINGLEVAGNTQLETIMLNKPVGYVVSRTGQNNKTIYKLLPPELHNLKPIGRLDKDSSGLLLLTNDGKLANKLTHPRYKKEKTYEIKLDKPLKVDDSMKISEGVLLEDGISKLELSKRDDTNLKISMSEGRNRQIRRTFAALGYRVIGLHRTKLGEYRLDNLKKGQFIKLK